MSAQWEAGRVKAQLRLAAQRLGQLQDRMESQAQITQRDIVTLLQQGNVALARAKAQKQMREDIRGNLLQMLEMHIGVILGHLNELERSDAPSPIVIEAASSIIYAGPKIDLKDLHQVREFLLHALSPDFARSALENRDNYVSPKVLRAIAAPPPSAVELDMYLYKTAHAFGVQWLPDLSPQQKVNALSSILDPEIVGTVDLARLRSLCSHGLPSHPPWLRPRVWKILLGTLPVDKSAWRKESRTQRDNYYDLVRRLLEPLAELPDPTEPLDRTDQSILDVSNELSTVPRSLLASLEEEPEPCPQCPLDDAAPEDLKISCAGYLDVRLKLIRSRDSGEAGSSSSDRPEIRLDTAPEIRLEATPEVRLEEASPTKTRPSEQADAQDTPEISLSVPDSPKSTHSGLSTTLLPSRPYSVLGAHPKHYSALLRLLYIHSCLNPANRSPQIASLLVPIYAALVEEVDEVDLPHVEADVFWVFESMVGEFAELEDEQNGAIWVRKLSERLRWADAELADDMATKGLDPGLPHYSFRWLIPLLTHTLPLPAVLMVWDALFSQPMRERDVNPKLDYLMDVCTGMLLCARATLLQLGRGHRKSQNLWSDEVAAIPSTAFGERELEEAFIEGMSFLQSYPLDAVGGIEKVLQAAFDLATQRASLANAARAGPTVGLGARLRDTMWKGFSSLESHPEEDDYSEESEEEEEEHAKPAQANASTLTSRLANTVWRGITNQSAMESPSPSPSPTPSPLPSPLPSPSPSQFPTSQSAPAVPPKETVANAAARGKSMIWGYTEKLKDSDAAATLAKVTTNWRVKALDAWTKRGNEPSPNTLAPPPVSHSAPSLSSQDHSRSISLTAIRTSAKPAEDKRSSVPAIDRSDAYSPPPRPAFFRPVRDSVFVASPVTRSGEGSPVSDAGSGHRESLKGSLSSFKMPDGTPSRTHSGPRPLLLSSSTLMTGSSGRSPISPAADSRWAESVRSKRPSVDHRASQSSISSLSPSEPYRPRRGENRSDWESDGGTVSRIVPLNRKSPSPMARTSRSFRRESSTSSISPPTPPTTHRRLSKDESATESVTSPMGWGRVDAPPDSPTTNPSPPPPGTPDATTLKINTDVHVEEPASHRQQGSVSLNDNDVTLASPALEGKPLTRRTATISRLHREAEFSDSSATEPSVPTPVRRKRFPNKLQSLRHSRGSDEPPPPLPTNNSLQVVDAPEEPEHESARTPRAGSFDSEITAPPSPRSRRPRKISTEGSPRPRKISTEGRTRKISNEGRRKVSAERETKHKRESAAVEGDDEGYGELLSAYESEDAV
ncbi:regulator of Vps4 activity in the MVB pathway-domain-containing protein [Trametes maxima]|nr:regulator of Vps4 activity in the MVB pathway-domain-containing protein [Trametes maxima]